MVTITRATLDDAPAILELQKLAYQSEAQIYNDFQIPPLIQTLDELTADFPCTLFLKAEADSQIVGSVRAHQKCVTCHIERLIVHPDFQNQGVGKELMAQIESSFCQARRFELFTGHKSEHNLRFYEQLGYSRFKTEEINPDLSFVFLERWK